MVEINEIAANDEFVCGWSEITKGKVASSFLSFLKKTGFVKDMSGTLSPIYLSDEEFAFYLRLGEAWFLDACLLQQYEINHIKQVAL